jgi:hypothetical protein
MENNELKVEKKEWLKDFQIKIGNDVIYDSKKDLLLQMGYGRYPDGGVYEYSKKPLSEMIGKSNDKNQ